MTEPTALGFKVRALLRPDIVGFVATIGLFLLWPELDLIVAANYFNGTSFTYADNSFVRFVYLVFAKIHFFYLLLFIGSIAYCAKKGWASAKKNWVYLLITLLLGPGILVNIVLKDNSVGRPRPQHITEFGGNMVYAPVFHYSGECKKNCSFVSGHAAIGFYLLAVAWVRQRRVWFAYGIILGGLVGFVRIIQGGHFLSDVLFAGWFTYFTYFAIAQLMKIPFPRKL